MKTTAFYISFFIALVFFYSTAAGQKNPDLYQPDTVSFRLSETEAETFLITPDSNKIKIPKKWLFPLSALEQEEEMYVSSVNYQKTVTSFKINKKYIGLHLSSWDYMAPGSGSAMAASGRDIFLIYDPSTHIIMPGITDLGVTKDRVRSMGCFFASFSSFYLGDINGDSQTDIGIIKEKIWCQEEYDEDRQLDLMTGPYYKKYKIVWLIFTDDKFERDSLYTGMQPENGIMKLPVPGLIKSPVEFVREMYGNKLIEKNEKGKAKE